MNPNDIEKHSFEIIEQELEIELPSDIKPIVKRVIHTTADFSYAENMYFSPDAIKTALGEIKSGSDICLQIRTWHFQVLIKSIERT